MNKLLLSPENRVSNNLCIFKIKLKRVIRNLTLLSLSCVFISQNLLAQGLTIIKTVHPVIAQSYTGDKPQSKLWYYGNYWWTVIPVAASGSDPAGTYLFRLDNDTTLTKLIWLDSLTNIKADVKSVSSVTHIILKNATENNGTTISGPQFQQAKLISIEFVAGSPPTYQLWSTRSNTVFINLKNFAETATIDVDSNGRMWLASDGSNSSAPFANKDIYVKWSDPPYNVWSSFINMNESNFQVKADDICAITAFGGNKIGVLWSDQILRGFRFRYHNDNDNPATWSTIENAKVQATPGSGVADDHINLAVSSDGTIYAAIKTSFDSLTTTRLGLLVRRPSGSWDNLYTVTTTTGTGVGGTRPIILLNESEGIISIFYTSSDVGGSIRYKESSVDSISFPPGVNDVTFTSSSYNDVTSTKQNIGDQPLVLFSNTSLPAWTGVKLFINRENITSNNGAGYSFFLNGINGQGIRVNKTTLLNNIATNLTMEAWFRTNVQADQEIINYLDPPPESNEGYALSLTAAGKIRLELNTGTLFTLDSQSDYPLGKWTHVAATYNSSQSAAKIYLNGIEVASGTKSGSLGNGNSDDFLIGARDPGPGSYVNPFNGSLDEIRLWNVTRSENELRSYMSKKLDIANLPGSLVGYWNFNQPSFNRVVDVTNNGNDGSLININAFQFQWSGAAIGDDSKFDYTGSGGVFSQSISHSNGDSLTATTTSSASGIQVYRVDAPPMRQEIPGLFPGSSSPFDAISLVRYYGVKVIGSGNPTYDIVYYYLGHPGIDNQANLELAFRDNLNDDTWEDLNADLNTTLGTLSKTGLTGTEFALASSGGNPLPVELAYFTGKLVNDYIKLEWKTETEVSNYGFDIERSTNATEFSKIAFIEGHGNSNSPKFYSFSDPVNGFAGIVYYRLKQIDTDGAFSYSNTISVNVGIPTAYELFQNYPNPFNPNTVIRFQLPEKSNVTLRVFNSIGEQVAELLNEEKDAGYYEVNFNAKNLASGIYVYSILANGFFDTKKMVLIK